MEKEKNMLTRSRTVEFSTRAEGEELIIEGYFVVFDSPYYMDEYWEEVINRNAFEGCDMTDVRALIDHNPRLVLGRTTSNTLELSIDDTGLYGRIRINSKDTDALNLYARTQRGDVDQASFGFDERGIAYTDLEDGRVRQEITGIKKLWEVSVCTFPAYEETFVEARSRTAARLNKELTARKKEKLKRRLNHGIEKADP